MAIVYLDKEKYSNEKNWIEWIKDDKTFDDIPYDESWAILFSQLKKDKNFLQTERKIRNRVIESLQMNHELKIYPHPYYTFRAFTATSLDELKVVILGQDPYFNSEQMNDRYSPQAMGLSFSVPNGMKIPSSLENIYSNMIKFKHLQKRPSTGNLWFWAFQSCLILNTALLVADEQKQFIFSCDVFKHLNKEHL